MINITCYSTQYARGCLYSKKSETPDDELPEARNMYSEGRLTLK